MYSHIVLLPVAKVEEVMARNAGFVPSVVRMISDLYESLREETIINLMSLLLALLDIEEFTEYSGPSIKHILCCTADLETVASISATAKNASKQLREVANRMLDQLSYPPN